jgi:hypothetical protein
VREVDRDSKITLGKPKEMQAARFRAYAQSDADRHRVTAMMIGLKSSGLLAS